MRFTFPTSCNKEQKRQKSKENCATCVCVLYKSSEIIRGEAFHQEKHPVQHIHHSLYCFYTKRVKTHQKTVRYPKWECMCVCGV